MAQGKAHQVWIEQCEAAKAVKARFGLKAAFDYIVREKLLNFAETSARNTGLARELPRFLSEVRRMFTPDEIATQLSAIERSQDEIGTDLLNEDDYLLESPRQSPSVCVYSICQGSAAPRHARHVITGQQPGKHSSG